MEWPSFPEGIVMAGKDKPRASRAGGSAEPAGQRAKAPADRPFDMWLQKQLHAMYDEIASEPLPGDLLNIIDHDAAQSERPEEHGKSEPRSKKE